jgi:hypothetical protein
LIIGRPFAAKDAVNDQQLVYMAKEILEYHKLIDTLKEVLGINLIEQQHDDE